MRKERIRISDHHRKCLRIDATAQGMSITRRLALILDDYFALGFGGPDRLAHLRKKGGKA